MNKTPSRDDCFRLLGLPTTASFAQLKQAYRQLVFRFHPDRTANDPSTLGRFLEIQRAWEALSAQGPNSGTVPVENKRSASVSTTEVLPRVKVSVRLAESAGHLLIFCGSMDVWPSAWCALQTEAEVVRARVQGELNALWSAFEVIGNAPNSEKEWAPSDIHFSAELSADYLDELSRKSRAQDQKESDVDLFLIFFAGSIFSAFDWNDHFHCRVSVNGRKTARETAVAALRPWFARYGTPWDDSLRLVITEDP